MRTMPTSFPLWRLSDFNTLQVARSAKLRRLAQSCNWLWGNMVRYHAAHAYEGNGRHRKGNQYDAGAGFNSPLDICPSNDETTRLAAKLICSILVPPNWGPSSSLRVYGEGSYASYSSGFQPRIIVGVYDLDDNYLGITESVEYDSPDTEWELTVKVPQDRPVQVKVWDASTLGVAIGGPYAGTPDDHYLLYVCARYDSGVSADLLSGDTPPTGWEPVAHDFIVDGQNPALSSCLLKALANNILHLYCNRPPHVMASSLLTNYHNTSTFTEVARYKVKVGPDTEYIAGKFEVFCTHGGAGNEFRIKVDGVVKETFTALAAEENTLSPANIAVVGGTEIVITFEAKSTAASADWGTMLHGVFIWEASADLNLPTGSTVPMSYVPIDEDEFAFDGAIHEDTYQQLTQNITWLAANRLNTLIGDWLHRTYKRVDTDGSGYVYTGGDWTRGEVANYFVDMPKNISVYAQSSVVDAYGYTDPNDVDGLGYFPYGLSIGGFTTISSWPVAADLAQKRHGNRVGHLKLESSGSVDPIDAVTGAQVRAWVRGKRRRPFMMMAFDGGSAGPLPEEPGFVKTGRFRMYNLTPSLVMEWGVVGNVNRPDHEACWYGPDFATASTVAAANIRGQTFSNLLTINPLQGSLFEMELNGACIVDVPLTQSHLDAL